MVNGINGVNMVNGINGVNRVNEGSMGLIGLIRLIRLNTRMAAFFFFSKLCNLSVSLLRAKKVVLQ